MATADIEWYYLRTEKKNLSEGFRATNEEIESQANDLSNYADYLKSLNLENARPEDAIFCGAGDSLACSIFVERLMNFKPRSFDPYDIVLYPEIMRGKKVYFISVSGRTRANIQAVKLAKRRNAKTIAITANPQSELAEICSETIELKFTKAKGLTPGTNSFTTSLLACASLFKNIPKLGVAEMIRSSKAWVSSAPLDIGSIHFVGSGSFFAIAMYGAAKIFEFTGGSASYQLAEQFSHMNLFSVKEDDLVVVLPFGAEDEKANDLISNLMQAGRHCLSLPIKSERENVLQKAISYSIHLQYLALNLALRKGLREPSFLSSKDLLRVSDEMIY